MCDRTKPLVVFGDEDDIPDIIGKVVDAIIRDNGWNAEALMFVSACASLYRTGKPCYTREQIRDILAVKFVRVELDKDVQKVAWR
jgi:hypothetical protein